MLYLEDFLELIEHLPQEVRDRLAEMRNLDATVQKGMELINRANKDLFEQWASLSQEERNRRKAKIKEEYARMRALSNEKVAIADGLCNLLEKYSKKLSKEILHFKYELEADNPGITEQIEKKFYDAERAALLQRKERRKRARENTQNSPSIVNGLESSKNDGFAGDASSSSESDARLSMNRDRTNNHIQADDAIESRITGLLANVEREMSEMQRKRGLGKLTSNVSGTLSSPTLMSFPQNAEKGADRNTGNIGNITTMSVTPSALFGSPSSISPNIPSTSSMLSFAGPESRHGRPRKLTPRVQEMIKDTIQRQERRTPSQHPEADETSECDESDHDNDKRNWCICNQKSYGCMVACDNKECPVEWFHIACIGLSQIPKGKWFCSQCIGMNDGRNDLDDI